MLTRRHFLAATSAALALPGLARAGDAGRKRFVFVLAYGGWDPTRVFAPVFDNPNVDGEADADLRKSGGISFVDHASRPSVRAFFDAWHGRSLIVNGMLVPSVGHETCLKLVLTGSTAEGRPDWPAALGGAAQDVVLPHLVVDAPSFAGPYGLSVARTGANGQLEGLLDGSILGWSDAPASALPESAAARVEAHLAARLAARSEPLAALYAASLDRATALRKTAGTLSFTSGTTFAERAELTVEALSRGLVRCVTLQHGLYNWDSHTANDVQQSANFEDLFASLLALQDALSTAEDPDGDPLSDSTVLVVLSEMGRTPKLNVADGKDHWPWTSALLVGPGIAGDRVLGGYDEVFAGVPMDETTGEIDEDGSLLGSDRLGATLLALGGVDSSTVLPGVDPFPALLAPT